MIQNEMYLRLDMGHLELTSFVRKTWHSLNGRFQFWKCVSGCTLKIVSWRYLLKAFDALSVSNLGLEGGNTIMIVA